MSKYDELANDLANYLAAKLPAMDEATTMEVSEYISNRVQRYTASVVEDVNRDWRQYMKSQARYTQKEFDRLRKLARGNNDG